MGENMEQVPRQWSSSPKQLALIVVGVIVLYLLAGVVGRTLSLLDLKEQEASLRQTRAALIMQIQKMRDDIEYMRSDSYVEQAARTMLLWGRPNERLLLPAPGSSVPGPTQAPARRP